MDELDLALSSIFFLTLREKFLLKKNLDSLDALAVLSMDDISSAIQRPIKRAEWNGRLTARMVRKAMPLMQSQGICGVRLDQEAYPPMLRQVADAPYMLYFRGSLECLYKPCVSVVGTRRICREAAQATMDFCSEAASLGYTVVSGLAGGADSFAHRGAISSGANGATAAVLPCGIDTVVPAGNKALAARILHTGGVLVSEYIPGVPSESWRFVQRNRIIAALSSATVVTQAPSGSGALITADFALGYNREVVLHKSCFCEEALAQDKASKQKLAAENKKRSSVGMLSAEGAPVVEDFTAYVKAMQDEPGTHTRAQNGELF